MKLISGMVKLVRRGWVGQHLWQTELKQHKFETLTIESEIELLTHHTCGVFYSKSATIDGPGSFPNFCGADLAVNSSRKYATLGGVLFIDDRPFGLTVAHVFDHDEKATVARSSAIVRFYDSSGDKELDSGYTDEGDDSPPLKELTPLPKDSATADHRFSATNEKKKVTFSITARVNGQGILWHNYDCSAVTYFSL